MPHTILQARAAVRDTRPLARARSAVFATALAASALAASALILAGCASGPPAAVSNIRYDLGAPLGAADAMNMPAVKVLSVSASRDLDSDAFVYRLQYADAQRTGNYSNAHWTMPPAQLLTRRLRDAMSAHGTVLTGAEAVKAPVLQVELNDFEQIFDAPGESHGVVAVRATLTQQGKIIGQRTFVSRAPSSTADAAGGARALSAASDELIAQMTAWLGVQPLVASQ
jgi:cholesterol transport system auxiliary component